MSGVVYSSFASSWLWWRHSLKTIFFCKL